MWGASGGHGADTQITVLMAWMELPIVLRLWSLSLDSVTLCKD